MECKCPRCRVGKVYENPVYSFGSQKILKSCAHCGLIYEREPGYFYAAMYVSYGFIVGELVTIGLSINILTGSSNPWLYISIMLGIVLLLAPFNHRYSRMMLLYFLTPGLKYNPSLSSKQKTA